MKLIKQYWQWEQKPPKDILQIIEKAGRTAYKSEDKITEDSAERFVKMLVKSGHHSVIEHLNASVRFICDRGISHEIVRHRLSSITQESTRWCNYGNQEHITFIIPPWFELEEDIYNWYSVSYISSCCVDLWLYSLLAAESTYKRLIEQGQTPQQARSVLPNSLKTELVFTANIREWVHIFKLRTRKENHPQMRELMLSCLEGFRQEIPVLFDYI